MTAARSMVVDLLHPATIISKRALQMQPPGHKILETTRDADMPTAPVPPKACDHLLELLSFSINILSIRRIVDRAPRWAQLLKMQLLAVPPTSLELYIPLVLPFASCQLHCGFAATSM